jgi:lipid II:glycine glycyltransferase (peptidoglycan interpeptide bridge formation enzyme)
MSPSDTTWDAFACHHPNAHSLQSEAWGQLKSRFGWKAHTLRVGDSGSLVLFRRLPLGLTLAYVPRGPLANWEDVGALWEMVRSLDQACRARQAVFLKVEPELPDRVHHAATLHALGFRPSPQTIQPRRTILIDLSGTEDDLLARMKQKTRYNIRLAAKKGVAVRAARSAADVDAFNALMQATGSRDSFGVHAPEYYQLAYELFHPLGQCELLMAKYQGEALAGVMTFYFGGRAWYFYGASSDKERNRMAPYLAQWEAIRWAKARGALTYDLWGVPDEDEATLEAQFEGRHDGLWGVYRFKRGWGGTLTRTIGAWDKVYNPTLYTVYRQYLKWRRISLG